MKDREPTEKRQKLLDDFETMTKQEKEIDERLKTYRKNDPVVIKEMEDAMVTCVEAINRWTDNAYNCKSYMVKKLNAMSQQADQMLGITEDFDYIEMPKPIVTEAPKVLEEANKTPSTPQTTTKSSLSETPMQNNTDSEEIIDNQPLNEKGSPMGIPIEIVS